MKADAVLLWVLILLLLLAMVLTVLFAPRRSLHGYGELTRPGKISAPSPAGAAEGSLT